MKRIRSSVALTLAVAFVVTQAGWPLPALADAKVASPEVRLPSQFQLTLPPDLGTIQNLNIGTGPTLIHLQDAHGNYEAQKKIAQILAYLKQNYGIKLLLVEGDAAKLNPANARLFPKHMEITREVLDELAKDAIAQGEELFLLDHPDVQVYGIENLEAYVANGRTFKAVLTEQEKTGGFIRDMDMQIERLTGPYLNKDLRAFLKRLEDFEAKRLPMLDWLSFLKSQARASLEIDLNDPAYQIDWPTLIRIFKLAEFESKIDMKALVNERREFLKMIPQSSDVYGQIERLLTSPISRHQLPDPETGLLFEKMVLSLPQDFDYNAYPNLKMFIGHLILQSEVKGEFLMEEMNRLADQISEKLAKTEAEKKILTLLKDHRLLKRLFALELSPEDYDVIASEAKQSLLRPSQVIQRFVDLNGAKRVRNIEFTHTGEMDSLFEKAMEFYRGVKERDEWMLENIEARFKETGADKAVVITGGFHAGPFKNFFAQKNYNYALIAPKITTTDGREAYIHAALTLSTRKLPKIILGFDMPGGVVNSKLARLAIMGKTSIATAHQRMELSEVVNSEGSRLTGTRIERLANGATRMTFADGLQVEVPTTKATFQAEVTASVLDTSRVRILQEPVPVVPALSKAPEKPRRRAEVRALVLSRGAGEKVKIGDDVAVTVRSPLPKDGKSVVLDIAIRGQTNTHVLLTEPYKSKIVIDSVPVTITFIKRDRKNIRLSFEAPRNVKILRSELLGRAEVRRELAPPQDLDEIERIKNVARQAPLVEFEEVVKEIAAANRRRVLEAVSAWLKEIPEGERMTGYQDYQEKLRVVTSALNEVKDAGQAGPPERTESLAGLTGFPPYPPAPAPAAPLTGRAEVRGRVETEEEIKGLLNGVQSQDPEMRRSAVLTFKEIARISGDDRAVNALTQALKDKNLSVRLLATRGLAEMNRHAEKMATGALPQLIELLKDNERSVRYWAAMALGKIGKYAPQTTAPALVGSLKDTESSVRYAAAYSLGRIHVTKGEAHTAYRALSRVLRDDDNDSVREAAGLALAKIDKNARRRAEVRVDVTRQINIFRDHRKPLEVRVRAAREIGSIAPQAPIEERVRAARALLEAFGDNTFLNIVEPEDGGGTPAIDSVTDALVRIGPSAVIPVAALFTKNDLPKPRLGRGGPISLSPDFIHETTADILARIGEPAVSALAGALSSDDRVTSQLAAGALGKIGPQAAASVPALVTILGQSTNPLLREEVVKTIGAIGPSAAPAVGTLVNVVGNNQEYPSIRREAAAALGRIGPAAKEAVHALIEALKAQNAEILPSVAAEALGKIEIGQKESAAIPDLQKALKDNNLRLEAQEALLKIAGLVPKAEVRTLPEAVEVEEVRAQEFQRVGGVQGPSVGVGPAAGARPVPEATPVASTAVSPSPEVTANPIEVVQDVSPESRIVLDAFRRGVLPLALASSIRGVAIANPAALGPISVFLGIPLLRSQAAGPAEVPVSWFQEVMGAEKAVRVEITQKEGKDLIRAGFQGITPDQLVPMAADDYWQNEILKPRPLYNLLQILDVINSETGFKQPLVVLAGDKKAVMNRLKDLLTNQNNGITDIEDRIVAASYAARLDKFIEVFEPHPGESSQQALARFLAQNPDSGTLIKAAFEGLTGYGNFVADEKIAKNVDGVPFLMAKILEGTARTKGSKVIGAKERAEELLRAALIREIGIIVNVTPHGRQAIIVVRAIDQFLDRLRSERRIAIYA